MKFLSNNTKEDNKQELLILSIDNLIQINNELIRRLIEQVHYLTNQVLEIKLLIDKHGELIDYLENKNKEHQGVIDANNEVIDKLKFVINDLQNGYDLINNQTYKPETI